MDQPPLFRGLFPSIRQVKAMVPQKPLSDQEISKAMDVRRRAYGGKCPHEPACGDWQQCVKVIARAMRAKGYL